MQSALNEGGFWQIAAHLLLAYVSIFPVGLCFCGQALCVLLRGLTRLGRAIGWMLGTVWECAWGEPEQRAMTVLARLLLALAFVVWLPLASWAYYDGELRSWPCGARTPGAEIWARAEPTQEADIVIAPPEAELRCFTRTVEESSLSWRRIRVDGKEAWVQDWLLQMR